MNVCMECGYEWEESKSHSCPKCGSGDFAKEKLDLEKYGFRKDFDWDTRFNLKTRIGNYEVSTVDLGLNYQFDNNLPPLYYETMIFEVINNEVNYSEIYCDRYTTEEEARKGHEKAIEYVKNKLKESK